MQITRQSQNSEWMPEAGPIMFQGVDITTLGCHLYSIKPPPKSAEEEGGQLESTLSAGIQVRATAACCCS